VFPRIIADSVNAPNLGIKSSRDFTEFGIIARIGNYSADQAYCTMPHKHTRIRDADTSEYNLPPTVAAKALAVGKHGQSVFSESGTKKRSKRPKNTDDTPKSFARLMAWHSQGGQKRASDLDNGERKAKKQKTAPLAGSKDTQEKTKPAKVKAPPPKAEAPKILPGESLRDFAARVDQALPVAGLTRKTNKNANQDIPALCERRTKTEKRMHKMYDEWRKEDTRRKDKLEEAREREEELVDEDEAGDPEALPTNVPFPELDDQEGGKKRKSKRKRRLIGETDDKDDDPWAELNEKRDKPKGLHDVAQAPPQFKVIPREKFKVRNGAVAHVADVPGASGSLKRREELGEERKAIIERYRAMMGKGQSTI